MTDPQPLIVTAALDDLAFDWFDDLRRRHFPPERNQVPAHLTLFHALPGAEEPAIAETLKAACRAAQPISCEVRAPWSLGRGVAYRISSPALERLRAHLAQTFAPLLTRQDQAAFRPHVTVQNKVEPHEAKALLQELQFDFEPFTFQAEGLLVWRYLGGPWAPVARLPFGGAA
jgi:2'-5' RNA ligase